MNVFLWVLQILLALHTIMGAGWKFFNSELTVPSLSTIPHGVWLALIYFELLCSLALILPAFKKSLGILAPIAAFCIVVEMLTFTAVHLNSGVTDNARMIYWLVLAAFCAFITYGRFVLNPINKREKA